MNTCPLCTSSNNSVFLDVNKYYLYLRCKKCSGIFSVKKDNVNPRKNKTYLDNPEKYLKIIDRYGQRWLLEEFEKMYFGISNQERGTLLEIGAGVGYFTLLAFGRGWDSYGIETSEKAAQMAKDIFRMDIEYSYLENYKTDKKYNSVVMIEVLEHLADPISSIDKIKMLCPNGVLFATTPNTESKHWKTSKQNIYVPDDHVFLYNKKTIKMLAKICNLKDIQIEKFGVGKKNDSNLMFAARF